MNLVSVVIVTHNSEPELGACLEALAGTGAEIIVVNNASGDGTGALALARKEARWILNPWNRGFAAAANQGIAAAQGEFVLLLNPDAVVLAGLDALQGACAQPGVAAAGGKLVGPDGRPQVGFMVRRFPSAAVLILEALGVNRLWPGNRVNRRYRCLDLDPEAPAAVEQPAGAFLMVRREVWRQLGGFDEGFRPLWFEDVDFLKRAAQAGYTVRYVPEAVAAHGGARSAGRLEWGVRETYWYGNLLRYTAKHFASTSLRAVCGAVMLGALLRSVVGVLRRGSLRPVGVYARVVRLAGVYGISGRGEGPVCSAAFAVQ